MYTKNEWKFKINEAIERQQQMDIAMDEKQLPETKKNKKDAVGATKAPTSCIPSAGIFAMGAAMQDGGDKYGPFNYRDTQVTGSVFFNAMMRHLLDWWEGQDCADDSGVHHLGHLMAGCAIVLDGISNGNFIDDRPRKKILGASRMTDVWKHPRREEKKVEPKQATSCAGCVAPVKDCYTCVPLYVNYKESL